MSIAAGRREAFSLEGIAAKLRTLQYEMGCGPADDGRDTVLLASTIADLERMMAAKADVGAP